jgi:Peptidase family M48
VAGPRTLPDNIVRDVTAARALTAGMTERFAVLFILIAVSGVQLAAELLQLARFAALEDHVNEWSPPWWLAFAVTAGLAFVAALLYLRLASGRRRRVTLAATGDSGGRLTGRLAGLTAIAGLDRPPRFVIDWARTTVRAVAYGLPRRPTVCLHGGLVARLESDPATFRAVVLRELAHLRNRDVGMNCAATAAWRVYVVALLVPSVVSAAWVQLWPVAFGANAGWVFPPSERGLDLRFLVTAACLFVLGYLARADALRTREAGADLVAARWAANGDARPEPQDRPGRPGRLASFLDLWRTQPSTRDGAVAHAAASAVFGVSALLAFLTGASAVLILSQLSAGTGPGTAHGLTAYWPALVAAAAVTAVTGESLWRAAKCASLAGQRASSGLRAGLCLGLGLVAGELLEGLTTFARWRPADPAYLLVLLLLGLVVAVWSAEFAACCARAGGRVGRVAMTSGLVAVGAAVTVLLAWWHSSGELFASGVPVTSDGFLSQLLGGPATSGVGHHALLLVISALVAVPSDLKWPLTATATALWAVPLAVGGATAWARRAVVAPRRLLAAVLAGAAGGLVSIAAGLAAMAWLHSWRVPPPERSGSFLLAYSGSQMACVIAGMVVAATVGAALGQRSRFLTALVATGVAASLGIGGAYLLVGTDGCVGPLAAMASSCSWKPAPAWAWLQLSAADGLAIGAVASAAAAILVAAGIAAAAAWRGSVTPRSGMDEVPEAEPGAEAAAPFRTAGAERTAAATGEPRPEAAARPALGVRIGRTAAAAVLTAAAVTTLIVAGPTLGGTGSLQASVSGRAVDVSAYFPVPGR